MSTFQDFQAGQIVREETDKAIEAGDDAQAGKLLNEQRKQAAMSDAQNVALGFDPLETVQPIGMSVSPMVELERMIPHLQNRANQVDQALEQGGWPEVRDWLVSRAKAFQAGEHITPMEEIAEMRQRAVDLDKVIKAIDPSQSLWTHPKTKQFAEFLNREADNGGFLIPGDPRQEWVTGEGANQLLVNPIAAEVSTFAKEMVGGIADPFLAVVAGTARLADKFVTAMGGGSSPPPDQFVEDENGNIVSNEISPPTYLGILRGIHAAIAGEDIKNAARDMGRIEEWEASQREGFEKIIHGAAPFVTLPVGLTIGGATKAMMAGGSLGRKGAIALAARLPGGARTGKILSLLGDAAGMGAGFGAWSSLAYGGENNQSYAQAAWHGAWQAPLFMLFGTMGKKAEWFLRNRAKMPQTVARTVGGGFEGLGFGMMEQETRDRLWDFAKDPTTEKLTAYMRSVAPAVLGLGGSKLWLGGRKPLTPEEHRVVALQLVADRTLHRRGLGEKVFRGEATPEMLAAYPKLSQVELAQLGQASIRHRNEADPAEGIRRHQELKDLEANLDVKTYELEAKVEAEMRRLEEPKPEVERFKVEAEPGKPIEEVARKPLPEEQLYQRRGREGLEPERYVGEERRAAKAERRAKEMRDPLEDPRFQELPKEVKDRLVEAKDLAERQEIFREHVPERRAGPRRAGEMQRRIDAIAEMKPGPEKRAALKRLMEETAKLGPERQARYFEEMRRLRVEEKPPVTIRYGRPEPFPEALETRLPSESRPGIPTPRMERGEFEGRPVRESDIIAEMEGRPGRPGVRIPFTGVRVGRKPGDPVRAVQRRGFISKKGALGLYKFFENVVRMEGGANMLHRAHEWSHAMHRHLMAEKGGAEFVKAVQEWGRTLPANAKADIKRILEDYPGSEKLKGWQKLMEAWAEFGARDLFSQPGLDAAYPAFAAEFRKALTANPLIVKQYNRIRDMIWQRYYGMGVRERVRSTWIPTTEKVSESLKKTQPTRWQRARDQVLKAAFEDNVVIRRAMEQHLEAVGRAPSEIGIMENPARLWDALLYRSAKAAENFIMRGIKAPDGTKVRGMRQIMKEVKGRELEFVDFLVASRSVELYRMGKTPGPLSPQEYIEAVKQIQRENPDFVKVARELKDWSDALVDWVARAGNLDVETAEKIKNTYAVYVPFFRNMEAVPGSGGARIAHRGTGIYRIRGAAMEIRDPLVAMQELAQSMIAKADANQVMSAMYKIGLHEAGGIASVVKRQNVPKDHPLRQVLDAIERQVKMPEDRQHQLETMLDGLREADALNPQTITLFTQRAMPVGAKSIVAFTPRLTPEEIARVAIDKPHRKIIEAQQGKLQWLEIDTKVYESLMGIDKPSFAPWMENAVVKNILRGPTAVVRLFATGINPAFIAANTARDILVEPIFTRDGKFRPFGGLAKWIHGGFLYYDKTGRWREMFDELGVKTAGLFSEGQRVKIAGQRRNFFQKFGDMINHTQEVMSGPENFIRIAEMKRTYQKAIKDGKTEMEARMEAAEGAREVTVNFARAGIFSRYVNQFIPYFNAGLQGQRRLFRQLVWGGDPHLSDAEKGRVQRAAFLNGITQITLPALAAWWMYKDEDWYQDMESWQKVSFMPFKIGDTIYRLPYPFETGVLFGALPVAMMEANTAEHGNPAETPDIVKAALFGYMDNVGSFLPAFIRPTLEVAAGYDFFRERQLTPEWVKKSMPPEDQAHFYTSLTAKWLSEAVNGALTPIEIEHWLGGHTAGKLTAAMRLIDDVGNLKDMKESMQRSPLESMFRRFIHEPYAAGRYANDLRELSVDLQQRRDELRGTEKALRSRVERGMRRIGDIRKQMREGKITREEGNEDIYNVARPIVEHARRIQ